MSMHHVNTMRKFAYFGTPYVARDTLALLIAHGYAPSVVVTAPAALRGRGLVMTPTETNELAKAHSIPVITPQKLDAEAQETIKGYGCEYAIVVAYGKILPQSMIDAFPLGILNIHYSLLPKYRGASPVEAAILNGDAVTGVSIQRMVYELDAGDVLAVRETPVSAAETTRELRARLIVLGAELLAEVLPVFESDSATYTPQDHALATKCGKIKKEDGELDFKEPLQNWRKYKAYAEWPGTYFFAERGGRRIRVKITAAHEDQGAFVIDRVVPEGKNEIDYATFTRQI
jgi:methionyl-tRNA formyltransferase